MADLPKPTFAQREGTTPIPDQLKPKELSPQLRAMLFASFLEDFNKCTNNYYIFHHWAQMFRDYHVEVMHKMPDEFSPDVHIYRQRLGNTFKISNYSNVFDFVEFVLRHPACPEKIRSGVERSLVVSRSAYRLVDGDTIIAMTDGQESKALSAALAATRPEEFVGVRTHLKNAAEELRNGRAPESVRESIHAVEALTQVLEPSATSFAAALSKLESRLEMHGGLKAGFASLYGFTSNAKGIRHSLGDLAEAEADEPLAIYMIGSCSSFVNYLIFKSQMNPGAP